MTAAGDSGTVSVGTAGRIMVGIAQCGAATTANTDTIVVTGNTGAETLTIDLSGGSFAPGLRSSRERGSPRSSSRSTSVRARAIASRSRADPPTRI